MDEVAAIRVAVGDNSTWHGHIPHLLATNLALLHLLHLCLADDGVDDVALLDHVSDLKVDAALQMVLADKSQVVLGSQVVTDEEYMDRRSV